MHHPRFWIGVPEKLDGLTIFCLPYKSDDALVTDPFVERVRQAGLRGMQFVKLWPLPPGSAARRSPILSAGSTALR